MTPLRFDAGGQLLQRGAADLGRRVPAGLQQAAGGGVAFGVNGGRIQRVFRAGQAQEPGALLKRLGAPTP